MSQNLISYTVTAKQKVQTLNSSSVLIYDIKTQGGMIHQSGSGLNFNWGPVLGRAGGRGTEGGGGAYLRDSARWRAGRPAEVWRCRHCAWSGRCGTFRRWRTWSSPQCWCHQCRRWTPPGCCPCPEQEEKGGRGVGCGRKGENRKKRGDVEKGSGGEKRGGGSEGRGGEEWGMKRCGIRGAGSRERGAGSAESERREKKWGKWRGRK